MNRSFRRIWQTAILAGLGCQASSAFGQLRAFGEAEGFAAYATGGRNGSIYHVTNLNDSGAGSFRDAVSASNRYIVFDVGGNISLASDVAIKSNITIAGQTAPGGGIRITGQEVTCGSQTNVIMRNLHVSPGDGSADTDNGINMYAASNIMLDHVSVEFANWNNIDGTTGMNAITVQNSIIADPINQQFGAHTEGDNITWANNLWANAHNRQPLAKASTVFVNNVIYNYGSAYTAGDTGGIHYHDVVNNYFIEGPALSGNEFYQLANQVMYKKGNYVDTNRNGALDGANFSDTGGGVNAWSTTTAMMPTLSAINAFAYVVATAGANPTGRDQVDALVVSQVQTLGSGPTGFTPGTAGPDGGMYHHASNTGFGNGGLGTIASASRPAGFDADNDGIADTWEASHGLNSALASDSLLFDPLGYRMLEVYANSLLDVNISRTWTAASGNWATTANWTGAVLPGPFEHAFVRGTGAIAGAVTLATGTANGMTLSVGGNGPAGGETLNVSGTGILNIYDTITIGDQNNATLNLSGTGIIKGYNIVLGNTIYSPSATNYTGTFNFSGGTLQFAQIAAGAGAPGNWNAGGSMNWSGGSLEPIVDFRITAPIALSGTAGTFDTKGFDGTASGVISGSRPVSKTGAGILDLTGTNSYIGTTSILAGELGLSSNASLGDPANQLNVLGGVLRIVGNTLHNLDARTVNWPTFNGGFDIADGTNTFTVSNVIGGSTPVTKSGPGILVLSGANTFTGGIVLTAGTLSVAADNNLGPANNPITLSGGTFKVTGNALTSFGSHTPTFTTATTTTFDINSAANTFTVSQVIGGSTAITKAGPGVLILSGVNSNTGDTNITGGTLRVGNANALRKSTVNLTTSGVTLDLNGFNATFGGLSGNKGIDLKGLTLYVGTNTETYSGVISSSIGLGSIVKNGNGTWTVSGLNTYNGPTTVSAGVLALSSLANGGVASTLGDSSASPANLILDGGTLQFMANGTTDRGFTLTPNGGTLLAVGTTFLFSGDVQSSGAGNRTLTVNCDIQSSQLNGDIEDTTNVGGGKTSFVKSGAGRLFFDVVAKTYSGDTSVTGGILLLYKTNVMPYGPGKGNLSISTGAQADARQSQNINGLNGSGNLSNNSGTTRTVTLGNGDAGGTFTGVISSPLNIVKAGLGNQILSGTNTYTGTTTVNQGVLQFNIAGSIGGAGASVTVATGATAGAGYAIDQAFLARINNASAGAAGLAINSANALNFSAAGANLPNVSLGSVGNFSYTGTLTPYSTTYRLGGGTGTLTLPNVNALTGANNLTVVARSTSGPNAAVAPTGLNNYSGVTTIQGFLIANTFANGGSPSSIGQASNAPSNIVLDGGTLQYNGGASSTDRLFTLTQNGGTIDIAGGGSPGFTNTGLIGQQGIGNRTLFLTGTNGGTGNGWAFTVGDPSVGLTSVVKNGTGRWFANNNANTYSGDTTVNAGTLQFGVDNPLPFGSGKGNLVINGGTVQIYQHNTNINALNGTGGAITNNSAARTLTVGNANVSGNYFGIIGGAINLAKTGSGTQTLSGLNAYTGTTTITDGAITIATPGALPSGNNVTNTAMFNINADSAAGNIDGAGATNISGSGTVLAATHVRQTTLSVGNGAALQVLLNGGNTGTNVLTTLTLTGTGSLDLNNNDLVLSNGGSGSTGQSKTLATAAKIKSGLENGAAFDWLGNGIRSTKANIDNIAAGSAIFGIGIIQNNVASAGTSDGTTTDISVGNEIYTSFSGQTVGLNDTLAKYTYMGDADLSGEIDFSDYSLIDSGYLLGLGGWINGDFDYSGTIDFSDYSLIDAAYLMQSGSLLAGTMIAQHTAEFGPSYVSALDFFQSSGVLPEPGTLALLVLGAIAVLPRRVRRLCGNATSIHT